MTNALIRERHNYLENENQRLFDDALIQNKGVGEIDDDAIKYYMQEVSRYKLLSEKQERQLSKRVLKGDDDALNQLVNSNLRLVIKIAKRFMCPEYPLIDIIQDGNLGLLNAAKRFNYKKKTRFSTYAALWIKQNIQRNLYMRRRIVRLPNRKEIKARQIKKYLSKFFNEKNRYPTIGEISDFFNVKREDIELMLTTTNPVVSLEETYRDDSNTFKYTVKDEKFLPENTLLQNDLKQRIDEALSVLSPRDKEILKYRYGLAPEGKKTLIELGKSFGISPEAVRMIEKRALHILSRNFTHARDYLS